MPRLFVDEYSLYCAHTLTDSGLQRESALQPKLARNPKFAERSVSQNAAPQARQNIALASGSEQERQGAALAHAGSGSSGPLPAFSA